jgi:hypothetical protein
VSDHWLDRLATAHTRRQGLKFALAGALALLPLARARPAAARADNCTRPCLYEAQIRSGDRFDACPNHLTYGLVHGFTLAYWVNPGLGATALASSLLQTLHCQDRAALLQKAEQFDCVQPGCPGYTPDPHTLCPGCLEVGGKCCPAASSGNTSGYGCCPCCADNGDGCKAC